MSDESTPDLTTLTEVIQKRLSWASLHWFSVRTRGGIKTPVISDDVAPEIAKAVLAAGFGPVRAVEAERDALREALRIGAKLDNHHNAAVCPYCCATGPRAAALAGLREAVEALADDFADNVDWSAGRNNYGDNEAWESAARQLRALLPTPDREEARDE